MSVLEKPQIFVCEIPLKYKFRGLNTREIVFFKGKYGWTEFSPFTEYGPSESVTWLKAAYEAANLDLNEISKKFVRSKVPINVTIPQVSIAEIPGLLAQFPGCETVKLKVQSFTESKGLLAELIKLIPRARFRLDVNAGWNFSESMENLPKFLDFLGDRLDYVEQPVLALPDLKMIKQKLPIKIAIDESIRKSLHQISENINYSEFADVAIMKWAPSGGLTATLKLIDQIKLPVVISSALDSAVGLSFGLMLAQITENLYGPCGLGTSVFFQERITNDLEQIIDGNMSFNQINTLNIEKFSASTERKQWWQNRFDQVWEYFVNELN